MCSLGCCSGEPPSFLPGLLGISVSRVQGSGIHPPCLLLHGSRGWASPALSPRTWHSSDTVGSQETFSLSQRRNSGPVWPVVQGDHWPCPLWCVSQLDPATALGTVEWPWLSNQRKPGALRSLSQQPGRLEFTLMCFALYYMNCKQFVFSLIHTHLIYSCWLRFCQRLWSYIFSSD